MFVLPNYILGFIIASMYFLSNIQCYAEQCKDDLLGSTVFGQAKKLPRVYLEPRRDRVAIQVPTVCVVTQAVKAHACAPDAAPFVNVYNFNTVNVHRTGSLDTEIYVDITAYCNGWGGNQSDPIVANILPWEVAH